MTRFGFLSTFPPTRCGLATFTDALARALVADGRDEALVVRVDDLVPAGAPSPGPGIRVIGDLHPGDGLGRSRAASALSQCDMVIVQHEFGIYGGADGDEVIDVLERILSTRVVVLHTVPADATPHQRAVLRRVTDVADVVVVMTHAAHDIIADQYAVPTSRLALIPHGVDPRPWPVEHLRLASRPVMLTWGLIGPGKGIEWGIRALACMEPAARPVYRVLGQTHPKVVKEHGEEYRDQLTGLAADLRVSADVELDGHYQDTDELAAQVASAALVLLPYDSTEQATSGVLAEAAAAGKVVIATRFPHAMELLADGGGILVGHRRPTEIARAIQRVLGDPTYAVVAKASAQDLAMANSWPRAAERFRGLLTGAALERAAQ